VSARASNALSESELIERLRVRYTERSGNGDAWAFMAKVRSAAGFDARRTIDAYAMSLWPSRGLSLLAFEVKSSRGDWLRELKNPAKAEEYCELADYFYLVVGDKSIVKRAELPESWGLLVPHGRGLKAEVDAPRLRPADGDRIRDLPPGFGRSFLAALLRAACYVGTAQPPEIVEAEQRGREGERRQQKTFVEQITQQLSQERAVRSEFERAAQVQLVGGWPAPHSPAEVGAAVRLVLDGQHNTQKAERSLRSLREGAQRLVDQIDKQLPDGCLGRAA
jgi:hypothetical protein